MKVSLLSAGFAMAVLMAAIGRAINVDILGNASGAVRGLASLVALRYIVAVYAV